MFKMEVKKNTENITTLLSLIQDISFTTIEISNKVCKSKSVVCFSSMFYEYFLKETV